jgi:hypothetical protein
MNAESSDGRRARQQRDGALLEVEVRRVMHALAPYGVLRQDALARACGARRWREGQFHDALDAAVATGRVRRLPFGFYASRAGAPRSDRLDGRSR